MKDKLFKCKYCKQKVPILQIKIPQVCKDKECIQNYFNENAAKVINQGKQLAKKKHSVLKSDFENKHLSQKQRINKVKPIFQKWIRQRDAELPCISCGEFKNNYDAGHYLKAEIYTGVIFDEYNVHKQCVHCNQHLDGNPIPYRINLIKKIGLEKVEALEYKAMQTKQYKFEQSELDEIEKKYKKLLQSKQ